MSDLLALVLAAGQSRRMKSSLSKVLHPIAGRPLLHYPVATAAALGASRIVVVTSPKDEQHIKGYLEQALPGTRIQTAVQAVARGTGDAVRIGVAELEASLEGRLLILYGDVPLVGAAQLGALARPAPEASLNIGTCRVNDPTGYGRIVRDAKHAVVAIREQRDLATDAERAIQEVNTGLYCAPLGPLREALGTLTTNNAQGEYYLTDIVPYFAAHGHVASVDVGLDAMRGVNDRVQLWEAQEIMNRRILDRHRLNGASIASNVTVDDGVDIGADVVIHAGCQLRGTTLLGAGCVLEVGCVLTDTTLTDGTTLPPYSVVTGRSFAGAR